MPSTSVAAQILTAIGETRAEGGVVLPEATAKHLLGQFGVRVPRGLTVQDLTSVPPSLMPPLVLKAVSPTLVHKSDAGGVRLGLHHDELVEVADDMRRRLADLGHTTTGYLVEEMAPKGLEVVLGAVRTDGLGWAVMVGLGGIFVEFLEDVAFGLAPLARSQIRAMLDELRGKALLDGARGGTPVDIESLVDVVYALAGPGGLLDSMHDDVVEVDLNPIIVSAHGAIAVDARFVLRDAGSADSAEEAAGADSVTRIKLYCKGFERLMEPQAVAVLGASGRGTNAGNLFIRNLKQFGFAGEIIRCTRPPTSLRVCRRSRHSGTCAASSTTHTLPCRPVLWLRHWRRGPAGSHSPRSSPADSAKRSRAWNSNVNSSRLPVRQGFG